MIHYAYHHSFPGEKHDIQLSLTAHLIQNHHYGVVAHLEFLIQEWYNTGDKSWGYTVQLKQYICTFLTNFTLCHVTNHHHLVEELRNTKRKITQKVARTEELDNGGVIAITMNNTFNS